MIRLQKRARDGERGAVLIEFAIVAMLLATMGFGILEYGNGWRSSMNVLTVARAGARSVSSSGTDYLSDYLALTSIRTNLDSEGMLSGLQKVVIYKSQSADGKPPAVCVNGGALGSGDLCNVYSASDVQSVAASQFNTTTGCKTGATATSKYCRTRGSPRRAPPTASASGCRRSRRRSRGSSASRGSRRVASRSCGWSPDAPVDRPRADLTSPPACRAVPPRGWLHVGDDGHPARPADAHGGPRHRRRQLVRGGAADSSGRPTQPRWPA